MDWPKQAKVAQVTARNATLIRKAFDESIDVDAVVAAWDESHPDKKSMTTSMARSWALAHVRTKKKPLELALSRLYADGYTLGDSIARSRLLSMVVKSVAAHTVDWSTWTPGMESSAALVRPTGGLTELLRTRKIQITDDVLRTKLDRIGTKLADSLERGLSSTETAKALREVVNDPQHALMIARTEMARSMSVATRDTYEKSNVEQVEWLVAEGCEDCQDNADASPIGIDETFPSGDSEPPAHPNCMCALAPVFDDSALPEAPESETADSIEGEEQLDTGSAFEEIPQEAAELEIPAETAESPAVSAFAAERNAAIENTSESIFDHLRAEAADPDNILTPYRKQLYDALPKRVGPDMSPEELTAAVDALSSDATFGMWKAQAKKALVDEGWAARTADTQVDIEVNRLRAYLRNLTIQNAEKEAAARMATATDDKAVEWWKTYEQNKGISQARLADALETGQPTIAVPRRIFNEILEGGRFKNQFETRTSGGTLNKPIRIDGEGVHLNIDANVPGKRRPIYGFLSKGNRPSNKRVSYKDGVDALWDELLNANGSHVNQYGDIRIILKPHMRERATVTLDDSLGSGQLADELSATNHDLVQMRADQQIWGVDNQGIPQTRYIELQYDKVTVEDFAAVLVPEDDVFYYTKLFKDKGLDIKVEAREAHEKW